MNAGEGGAGPLADGIADLHVHTTASDGTASVQERTADARERGLDAIAITDHDVIDGSFDRPASREEGLQVITGVEVRADVAGTKVELLGYYVDPGADTLQTVLERARQFRQERNRTLLAQLRDETGLDLRYEALQAEAVGIVGRPDIAGTLVERDVVDSVGAAFDEYIGAEGSTYVPMERIPAAQVIDALHDAGGVAVLAHPGRIRSANVPGIVYSLVEAGLDGLEVRYPYDAAGGPDTTGEIGVAEAADLAADHDVVPTGGSDCHGPGSGKYRLGSVRTPADWIERLAACCPTQ